jgi:ABC-type transport system substrate-binding protein
MIRKTSVSAIVLILVILMVPVYSVFPVKVASGPRSDVEIRFYDSRDAAFAALKAGDIDFIQGSLTYEQRMDVEADPNLCVSGIIENAMMQFDLNNNYTVAKYPGVRNPLHLKEFRRALSCMVDKQYIIDEILKGAGALLNVPISLNCLSWWPECALPGNYPWKYNETKAEEQLQLAGFVDTDDDGIRNYPVGWPGRENGQNMDPLVFYVRTEDERLYAGRYLADQLDLFGIPYNKIEATSDVCFPAVMDDRNYHIYTGGWDLRRCALLLYRGYYGSSYATPGGSNYVTGWNESGMPNYPDYDTLARQVYYTDSIASCRAAARAAATLGWCEYVFNIPLWSPKDFIAWRKSMPDAVNHAGYGLDNSYQFLTAYNTLDGPIRMGTVATPEALNPLYSKGNCEYAVLDRVFDSLMNVNPYDLGIDQPWVVQDWEVDTWTDPNPGPDEPPEKTKVTYYLRKDVPIIAPDGTFVRYLTAHDVEFSCWYTYAFSDGSNRDNYEDVHHIVILNDYTMEYYFDDANYWFYTSPQYPTLARDELIDTLCRLGSVSFTSDGSNCTAGTQFKLTGEQIVHVASEDLDVGFIIFGGSSFYEDHEHNWIWIQEDLPAGTYTIEYYTPDLNPHGYYLAGLPWTETWYGFGPFYPTDIVTGIGGHASFNKNPYYWMETPFLGETDWRWVWDTPGGVPGSELPGRDSGHFELAIYDVVKATVSYCHCGYGPYDPRYFPGADLDASDLGHVGIYDVVTITGKYGLIWGTPPDP